MDRDEEILRGYQLRMEGIQKRGRVGEDVKKEVEELREALTKDLGHEPTSPEWGGVCGLEPDSGMTGDLEFHRKELQRFDNPPRGGEKFR